MEYIIFIYIKITFYVFLFWKNNSRDEFENFYNKWLVILIEWSK